MILFILGIESSLAMKVCVDVIVIGYAYFVSYGRLAYTTKDKDQNVISHTFKR